MNHKQKIPVIAIVGPTASGKTELAIKIAQKFNGEIISADSMQIYKEFNICTAKPTIKQQSLITHHCIGIISVREEFSVAQFVKIAQKHILNINDKGKIPILCGGTGLYIDSLLKNIQFQNNGFNNKIRKKLWEEYKILGGEKIYEILKKIDINTANSLHPNNIKKIIRALEFYFSTGKPISEQVKNSQLLNNTYNYIKISINDENRENLYKRIEKRVDIMVKNDILKEVEEIYKINPSKTASKAIGYKEFLPHLLNHCDLKACINTLKKNTRNYAKRQITWFKRDKSTKYINNSSENLKKNLENITKIACDYIINSGLIV